MSATRKTVQNTVVECGGYAYWTDHEVGIGDKVEVAVSSIFRAAFGEAQNRVVTSLSSDYTGPVQNINKVLEAVEK